ncbi:SRPBCC family protein [Agreia pratensis]|uniref:Polyketide cyclase / dehydrase and lipid transport n=1 Tax=Agreia pratensis TaxID=150121 RepID=A0A1X7JR51_9MICO|nr:SRPBCC family protein [Agreia pratensis]SMG29993.1 hypothetical protein SAMN06296010_1654 [Agreia pratensis]
MVRQNRALYVETTIEADIDEVWRLTQTPELHSRWDLRFSLIAPEADRSEGTDSPSRFRYERRLPFHTIRGTGVSLGERTGTGGARTSALVFSTRDPLSPLASGRGYWRYVPNADGSTTFTTGYDYVPFAGRAGALLDRVVLRRVVWWMTAWSFDRLRIWAETGTPPESWPIASVAAFWRADRPKASRCRSRPARAPRDHDAMSDAPASLAGLVQK